MVPHALFVSSDRHVDVALNVLTFVVGGALLATVSYLLLMLVQPSFAQADRGEVGPPVWSSKSSAFLAAPKLEFDLRFPPSSTIYRCEHRGQVTYSDRPCTTGRGRALPIRPF
jgi:hypothetical protein